MIKIQDIYDKTNNGLDIIYYFYPQARACVEGNAKHFKAHDERTPSATVREIKGVWKVTDFGDAGRAMSPIDICMQERRISFTEAIFFLAREFNVADSPINEKVNKPEIRTRPANDQEPDGHFSFKEKPFTPEELAVLGPNVEKKDCEQLKYLSVEQYSLTKEGKTTIFGSTPEYPIFIRRCEHVESDGKTLAHFYKIYQPLNPNKAFRFFYKGTKPEKYINGLLELKQAYKKYNDLREKDMRNAGTLGENDTYTYEKMSEVFICSGERDALCVNALNYYPIWFNSETYNLSEFEYLEIAKYAEKIYNIPDLDATGIRRAIELSSRFFDIHIVWLPEKLRTYRDRRGNPRKDFRDFSEIWPEKQRFKELLNLAMPFRFWDYKKNSNGQSRIELVSDYALHFLRCNGYFAIEDKNAKSGKMFVHKDNNIVKEVKAKDLRAYFRKFVRERYLPLDIRDLVNNSARLSDSSLDNLDETSLDFSNFTPTSQFFFFQNVVWEATSKGINEFRAGTLDRCVWDDEVIPHVVKKLPNAFNIRYEKNEHGTYEWDIDINAHGSNFFRYLMNVSRIYWRKELEYSGPNKTHEEMEQYRKEHQFDIAGPLLSAEEIKEQKHHLINKIFALGYLMHRYKSENRSWCIYAMDNKEGSIDESNGGTGKSFCFKTPRIFMKSVTLSGRNPKLTENKHIFENVNEHTKYILVDDADAYTPFGFFFDTVTGDLTVNPKNTKSYVIPFDRSPKFCITSNFVLRNIDASTSRRILYTVFSDYYHEKTDDNDYFESRTIYDDFGKNLFREKYSEEEWNADINFLVECCQFYLSLINTDIKLQPPMANVISRNLRGIMGENFLDWASVYFSADSENCDREISREDVFTDFKMTTGQSKWTPNRFMKSMRAFVEYAPHVIAMNPDELCPGGKSRLIRKVEGKTKEMIYIQTKELNHSEIEGNELITKIPY